MTDGQALPTSNTAASLVDKSIVELGNGAVSLAETAIIGAQSWLGLPVIKQIWEAIFSYIAGQIIHFLGTYGGYVAIDIQKYAALSAAAKALANLNTAKASGDQNAISQASSAVDDSVAPVLHYIGDFHV